MSMCAAAQNGSQPKTIEPRPSNTSSPAHLAHLPCSILLNSHLVKARSRKFPHLKIEKHAHSIVFIHRIHLKPLVPLCMQAMTFYLAKPKSEWDEICRDLSQGFEVSLSNEVLHEHAANAMLVPCPNVQNFWSSFGFWCVGCTMKRHEVNPYISILSILFNCFTPVPNALRGSEP